MPPLDMQDIKNALEVDVTPTITLAMDTAGTELILTASDSSEDPESMENTLLTRFRESIETICEESNEMIQERVEAAPDSVYATMPPFKPGHVIAALTLMCSTGPDHFHRAASEAMAGAVMHRFDLPEDLLESLKSAMENKTEGA